VSKNLSPDDAAELDRSRRFDPERGSFDPPKHPSLRDPQSNPRGVRHIDETAQDQMAVSDRPRYQAAQGRRARMIAAATNARRRLQGRPQAGPSGFAAAAPSPRPASPRQASEMHTVQTARHPDDIDLSWEQVQQALAALQGSHVAVRVIERSDPEMLLTVFMGTLGALGHAKDPALFWPVHLEPVAVPDVDVHFQRDGAHLEDVGFYLRSDRFGGAVGRAGCTVLAVIQGPVLINIRRCS